MLGLVEAVTPDEIGLGEALLYQGELVAARLNGSQFEALIAMYERGEIRPFVDRSFPFAEAASAHHYLHDRKAKGKLLLIP